MTSASGDHPDDRTADEEAATWFARLQSRSIGITELNDFARWRRDAGNASAYRRIEDLWGTSGELERDPEIDALVRKALDPKQMPRTWKWSRPALWTGLGVLVATCILVAAVHSFALDHGRTYRTAPGVRSVATLDDGSRMQIDTDTVVRTEFSQRRRRLSLERGQAFISVAHDRDRPFVVYLGDDVTVTAIGTEFDVRRTDNRMSVALVKGAVIVRRGTVMLARLSPGDAIDIDADAASGPIHRDAGALTAWRSGRLSFRATPLGEALVEVNRYSADPLVLKTSKDASLTLSGDFQTGDQEAFMKAVNALFGSDTVSRPSKMAR